MLSRIPMGPKQPASASKWIMAVVIHDLSQVWTIRAKGSRFAYSYGDGNHSLFSLQPGHPQGHPAQPNFVHELKRDRVRD